MKFIADILSKLKKIENDGKKNLTDLTKNSKYLKEYQEKFKSLRGLKKENKTNIKNKFNKNKYNNYFKNLIKYLKDNNYDISNKKIIITISSFSENKRNLFEDSGFDNPYLTALNFEIFKNEYVNWSILPNCINFDVNEKILTETNAFKCIMNSICSIQENSRISSIIACVNAGLFLNSSKNDDYQEELKSYFNNLYKSISNINKFFDYKIPVYFLMTEINKIFGYDSFLKIISKEEQDQILGVSNTRDLNDAYSEKVCQEMFLDFKNIVTSFVSKKIFEDTNSQDSKNLFLFTNNFFYLLNQFNNFVNSIFINKSVNQRSLLRGLYACSYEKFYATQYPLKFEKYKGLIIEKDDIFKEDIIVSDDMNETSKICFFRDLFLKKISLDFAINLPSDYLIKVNKINYLISIYLLLGVIFSTPFVLIRFHNKINISQSKIEQVFNNLSLNIKDIETKKKSNIILDNLNLSQVMDLFTAFDIIAKNNLSNIYAPSSYLFGFNRKINNLLERSLLVFEVNPVYNLINKKINKLILLNDKNINDDKIDDSYEYFFDYVENLNSIEKIINQYNALSVQMNVDTLNKIFQLVENVDLSDFFNQTNISIKNFAEKQNFKRIDFSNYKIQANLKFNFLLKNMLKSIENERIINNNSRKLISYLDYPKKNIVNNNYYEYFKSMMRFIDNINKKLDFYNSSTVILNSSGVEINLDKLSTMIKNSIFLDNKLEENLSILIKDSIHKRKKNVLEYDSVVLGPVYESDDKIGLKLSKPFMVLKNLLNDLNQFDLFKELKTDETNLNSYFIKDDFNWNNIDVDYLTRNIDIYKKYSEGALNLFPDIIRPYVNNTILFGLNKILIKELNAKQENKKNIDIDKDYILFNRKKDGIINFLNFLKFYDHNDIINFNKDISLITLDEVDFYLNYFKNKMIKNVHYEPIKQNFSWWDGVNPPALNAYGVYENRGLVDYIEEQNRELENILTENVTPLLEILDAIESSIKNKKNSNYLFWKQIKDSFHSKDKNSSFQSLNYFILTTLSTITADNCMTEFKNIKRDYSRNDFFTLKKNDILTLVGGACKKLYQNKIAYEYNKIIQSFNEKLSGKFPFVDDYYIEKSGEVDESSLKDFLLEFNSFYDEKDKITYILNSKNKYWRGANEFITKMKNVSDFMKVLDSDEKLAKDNSFQLEVNFNQYKHSESNTKGLIEKKIEISGKSISNLSLEKNIAWNPSEDVTFSFRWAKDYTQFPSLNEYINTEKYSSNLYEKTKTVSFTAKDKWSLIYFIRKNAMSKSPFYYSQDLLFKVPIKNVSNDVKSNKLMENMMSKIVIKIKFLNKDGKSNLKLPVFPDQVETIWVSDY